MGYIRLDTIPEARYLCDTKEDLNTLSSRARIGDTCWVIADAVEYMCNSKREWIKQSSTTSTIITPSGEIDLSNYVTTEQLIEEMAKIEMPEMPDLTNYVTMEDLKNISVDLTGYATEEYVTGVTNEIKANPAFQILGDNPDSFALSVTTASGKTLSEAMGEKGPGLYTTYVQKGVEGNPTGSKSSCRGICCVNTWYEKDSFYGWLILFDSEANCYTKYISVSDGESEWNNVKQQNLDGYVPIEKYDNLRKESLQLSRLLTPVIKADSKETQIAINNVNYAYSGTHTFNDTEFNITGQYSGLAELNGTFNNCIFNGTLYLYGDAVFNDCEFNISGDSYNIWTYSGTNVTFNNCKFFSDGKAVLVYGNCNTNVTVENCTFFDSGSLPDLKGAIEIGDDWTTTKTLTVNDTFVFGYEVNDKGINTNSTLWGNKNSLPPERLTVTVDGVQVY